ncbi:serine/threonine-protein kinase [Streptomyces sp. NPDC088785]|uniref:serine/threonine-protein kinase n=1 Tax=Streptomyces sp. NPDC088785 TaxID=3365897 RepID=UPI00382B7F1C
MEALGPGDPQRIGAYRLLGRLGAGGMGQVYLARSERGRTVAVKLVREELAEQDEFRDRFRQEVQAARQVGGAWTASVLDADTGARVPWVATAYVAGPSLQQVVSHDHGALPERSVRILAAGLAHAIKDVHAAGIVHRDLKPSNVLVTIDGPRVIDFGIARALETITDGGLTRTGALVGSPGFMAPEQVRGDRITPACDVFCLGSVLAYAATGALPFGTSNSGVHALMFRIAQEEPDLANLPEGLHELVRDCLRKEPGRRPTPEEILERTGAEDTLGDGGRTVDPWLPGALVAQLGRHAVRLLDSEDPDGGDAPAAVPAPAPPPPGAPGSAAPVNHLPTVVVNRPPTPANPPVAAPPNPPAYGYPPQAPAYGYPQGGWGQTPPYGPAPLPPQEPHRNRSSAALVAVALIVALGAGGSVYALMKGDGNSGGRSPQADGSRSATSDSASGSGSGSGAGSGSPSPLASTEAQESPTGPPRSSGPAESPSPQAGGGAGEIPAGFLGTWSGAIDNASGHHPRQITIQQGERGDTVMSLTADGYDKAGAAYHCVFQGELTSASGSTLHIGGTVAVVAEPKADCAAGRPSTITALPSGELRRDMTDAAGKKQTLTYTKSG